MICAVDVFIEWDWKNKQGFCDNLRVNLIFWSGVFVWITKWLTSFGKFLWRSIRGYGWDWQEHWWVFDRWAIMIIIALIKLLSVFMIDFKGWNPNTPHKCFFTCIGQVSCTNLSRDFQFTKIEKTKIVGFCSKNKNAYFWKINCNKTVNFNHMRVKNNKKNWHFGSQIV